MKKFLAALSCIICIQASAGVVVDNGISGAVTNNFNALGTGNVVGLITQTGATYGERFSGQTLSTAGGFDSLSGTPTSLTLLANATTANNIGILFNDGSNVIHGDLDGLIGEGALSILLASGTDVFGFNLVGANSGQFIAAFFAADGSLLGSISQAANDSFYGFRATGGDQIWGISLTNTDSLGIGFDNVTFNQRVQAVPEPGSVALLGLGLFACAAMRRRKK